MKSPSLAAVRLFLEASPQPRYRNESYPPDHLSCIQDKMCSSFQIQGSFGRHRRGIICVVAKSGRGSMKQGPFYESGTMTASVTKSEEEAQEPEKHVSNWASQVRGSKEQRSVQQRKGWGEKLPRTEIKSSRPNSTTDAKQGKQL